MAHLPNTPFIFSILAAIFALSSYARYIYSIRQGHTRPRTASWIVWSVVASIIAISYFLQGGGIATLALALYAVGPMLVLAYTYKYTAPGWSTQDTIAIIICAISIVLWWHFHSARIALFINIGTDSFAFLATIRAVRLQPSLEDWRSWCLTVLSATCAFMAVDPHLWTLQSFEIPAYPLTVAILNGIVAYYAICGQTATKETARLKTIG